jgi:hypothetical protein
MVSVGTNALLMYGVNKMKKLKALAPSRLFAARPTTTPNQEMERM